MAPWLSTAIGVLTALSLVMGILAIFPGKMIRAWTAQVKEDFFRVRMDLHCVRGKVDRISEHFDEDSEVSKMVGTLPQRLGVVEEDLGVIKTKLGEG